MPALKQAQSADIKRRILASVDRYPGLKDSGAYVAARVDKAREKDRLAEKEYWAHLKKFKEDVQSVFKLPKDSYAGKRSVQEAGEHAEIETRTDFTFCQEINEKAKLPFCYSFSL
eukprot:g1961.t1